jgi:hypothetical protein
LSGRHNSSSHQESRVGPSKAENDSQKIKTIAHKARRARYGLGDGPPTFSDAAAFSGLTALFDLQELKGAGIYPGVNGFYITVVGSAKNSERAFEVKPKHFDRLK